jgi:hypothetical protein
MARMIWDSQQGRELHTEASNEYSQWEDESISGVIMEYSRYHLPCCGWTTFGLMVRKIPFAHSAATATAYGYRSFFF